MRINDNDQITSWGLMILIFSYMVGFGILRLPHTVVKFAGHNGWLAIIAAGGIAALGIYLYTYLGQMFPEKTFISYSRELVGPLFGGILVLILVGNWLIVASYEVWATIEFSRVYLLKRTPDALLAFGVIILFIPFLRSGIEPLTRSVSIIFVITTGIIFSLIITAAFWGDYTQIQPIGQFIEFKSFIKAIRGASLPFLGFELIGIFFPYVNHKNHKKRIFKKNLLVVAFVITLYTVLTIVCIAYFGAGEMSYLTWPTVALFRSIDMPIKILERIEMPFIGIWVLAAFTTFAIGIEASIIALTELFKFREMKFWVVIIIPFIFIMVLLRENIVVGIKLTKKLTEIFFAYAIVVPLFLLLVAKIRGKGQKIDN